MTVIMLLNKHIFIKIDPGFRILLRACEGNVVRHLRSLDESRRSRGPSHPPCEAEPLA